MKIYYETEKGKIFHGDNLEIVPQLEQNIDLTLADPPYGKKGINSYRKNKSRSKLAETYDYGEYNWDDEIPPPEYFKMIIEKSTNQIIFGGNYFAHLLPPSPCWLSWDKDNGASSYADCELAWTSFETSTRRMRYRWHGMIQEEADPAKREKRYHPNQKPVGLFSWILYKYAKPKQTILDTHAGSGTTALACERNSELNLKWIIIDAEEKYCEIAAQRIEDEISQLKLF